MCEHDWKASFTGKTFDEHLQYYMCKLCFDWKTESYKEKEKKINIAVLGGQYHTE